jgi:hypothetical protein
MFSMTNCRPVTNDIASDERSTCPPPSPWEPSMAKRLLGTMRSLSQLEDGRYLPQLGRIVVTIRSGGEPSAIRAETRFKYSR